jgi:anti-sigma regulatory factor (Ser/Thr protein kinase)
VDPSLTDRISLTMPAASAAVRIARASAAALATRAGFTYREVEELQLAVGEAVALLAPEPQGDGTLAVTFEVGSDGLRVDLRLTDPGSRSADVAPDVEAALGRASGPDGRSQARAGDGAVAAPTIAAAVLDAAVDTWSVSEGGRRLVLTKQTSDADGVDDQD